MTTITSKLSTLLAAVLLGTTAASAATLTTTKSNGDFIPGSGVPADDFTIATANYAAQAGPTTIELGLKAHGRFGLSPVTRVGNRYFAEPGTSTGSAAKWNFAFQFDPGANGAIVDGLQVFLDVDFDPAAGATDFVTFGTTIPLPNSLLPYTTANLGAWSNATSDFVVAGSENMGFSYWSLFGKTFDANAKGEYQINLRARDAQGVNLATSTIFVVVPEPATLGLIGTAGVVALRRRGR